jgi:hypothetical protein
LTVSDNRLTRNDVLGPILLRGHRVVRAEQPAEVLVVDEAPARGDGLDRAVRQARVVQVAPAPVQALP